VGKRPLDLPLVRVAGLGVILAIDVRAGGTRMGCVDEMVYGDGAYLY
jgi:hypothetical protein